METTIGSVLDALLQAAEAQERENTDSQFYTPREFQKMLQDFAKRTGQEYFVRKYQLSFGVMNHPITGRFITTRLLRKCPCYNYLSEGIFDVFLRGNEIVQIHEAS